MIPYEQALETILSLAKESPAEQVALLDAAGRVLTAPVAARWPLPRFDNSAMDGFALRADDAATPPVKLRIAGESAAGRAFEGTLQPGEAVRISTGAEVPAGADSVVPVEMTETTDIYVVVKASVRKGQHIRVKGSDVREGQVLFGKGTIVTPEVLGVLAAYNISTVSVYRRLRVGILTSGDEILPLGRDPSGSEIIGSSLYYLETMLGQCGCEARLFGISSDRPEDFRRMLEETLAWSDVVVTTAGVSVGEHDVVGRVVDELGGTVHFWKVRVRPGKPMLLATYGDKVHFGFPGNPVSTCCNAEIFLKPFLRRCHGITPEVAPLETATLAADCPRDKQRLFFVYTRREIRDGQVIATPLANQNSGNLLLPALGNALAVIEPGDDPLPAGGIVNLLPIRPGLAG